MNQILYKKLVIIKSLFGPQIADTNGDVIDYETIKGFTRAWKIAEQYIAGSNTLKKHTELFSPTKDDLLYINKVVKKLISILGTDKNRLTQRYIETKLQHMPLDIPNWIYAYKQLIELIK